LPPIASRFGEHEVELSGGEGVVRERGPFRAADDVVRALSLTFEQHVRLATQRFLRTLQGFVKDALFEQVSGPGTFNVVTLVEWESADAVEAARKAATAKCEETGFIPQEFSARLGIEADVATSLETRQAAP